MIEGPNPFTSTKARETAERYVGADKVKELKQLHLTDQARSANLPLSRSRAEVSRFIGGRDGEVQSLATTSLKGRLERYEQALANAAKDAEKKFAKDGMPAPKGLIPDESPRLSQLNSVVESGDQAALRAKNGVPEKYRDVADLDYEDVRLSVYNEEAVAYRKEIAARYGETNVEKHFDDVALGRRQGEAMSEVYPKIKNYQDDLVKADTAITAKKVDPPATAPVAQVPPAPAASRLPAARVETVADSSAVRQAPVRSAPSPAPVEKVAGREARDIEVAAPSRTLPKSAESAPRSTGSSLTEAPKPIAAKLTKEQEVLAKKAGVDPRLNDLLANPKDYAEGREAFFKAMGAESGSARRAQLNNGGEYNRFLAKQKEFDSLNVSAAEKAAAKEQRDAAIAAINERTAGKPAEVSYLKLDRSGMVEGPNPFTSTKARETAERYVGADKVKELKQLHLTDQARSANLPLSRSRAEVSRFIGGRDGEVQSLATTSLKGRLERYEQALANAAKDAEKKFAKEGRPAPKGLIPEEPPRLSQLDSVVKREDQAALRAKNGVPEEYRDVADLDYADVRTKVYNDEAVAYRADIASRYGEKNVEKHFDDVALGRRQGDAMSEVFPKISKYQDDLANADAAIVAKQSGGERGLASVAEGKIAKEAERAEDAATAKAIRETDEAKPRSPPLCLA
ncbi:MAG: hypothetical protein EOP11_17265, partial [Proteobacteria bacterium]